MRLNPAATIRVEVVDGTIPVLYIEDFYADPMQVREEALGSSFNRMAAYYPGRHAPLEHAAAQEVLRGLTSVVNSIGNFKCRAQDWITDFSIVTTPASQLLPGQKHPHIDPTPVLGIVYLNPAVEIGTMFFHNRLLGFSVVQTDEQRDLHNSFIDEHAAEYAPSGYIVDRTDVWTPIYHIQGKFNRFVMYPGNVFHSIAIRDVPVGQPIEEARLTQRFILTRLHTGD